MLWVPGTQFALTSGMWAFRAWLGICFILLQFFFLFFFFFWFERQKTETGWDLLRCTICWFIPQIPTRARMGAIRIQSGSLVWVAGFQLVVPTGDALVVVPCGCIGRGRTQIQALGVCMNISELISTAALQAHPYICSLLKIYDLKGRVTEKDCGILYPLVHSPCDSSARTASAWSREPAAPSGSPRGLNFYTFWGGVAGSKTGSATCGTELCWFGVLVSQMLLTLCHRPAPFLVF